MVTANMKHCANKVITGWDDETNDPPFRRMLVEMLVRVQQDNPIRGNWCVNECEFTVWVDASSLVTGIVLEADGSVIKDACWLLSSTQC